MKAFSEGQSWQFIFYLAPLLSPSPSLIYLLHLKIFNTHFKSPILLSLSLISSSLLSSKIFFSSLSFFFLSPLLERREKCDIPHQRRKKEKGFILLLPRLFLLQKQ